MLVAGARTVDELTAVAPVRPKPLTVTCSPPSMKPTDGVTPVTADDVYVYSSATPVEFDPSAV